MVELKPCPFCGGKARIDQHKIYCSCGAEIRIEPYRSEYAIDSDVPTYVEALHNMIYAWEKRAGKVRSGTWVERGLSNPKCSLCRGYNIEKSNYCPNCGAKMDGKDGEENGGN